MNNAVASPAIVGRERGVGLLIPKGRLCLETWSYEDHRTNESNFKNVVIIFFSRLC